MLQMKSRYRHEIVVALAWCIAIVLLAYIFTVRAYKKWV
jgi:hypothetical protein